MANNSHSDINRGRVLIDSFNDIALRIFKIATGLLPDKYKSCQILRKTHSKKRYHMGLFQAQAPLSIHQRILVNSVDSPITVTHRIPFCHHPFLFKFGKFISIVNSSQKFPHKENSQTNSHNCNYHTDNNG